LNILSVELKLFVQREVGYFAINKGI
jgi:hypothetical protein